MSESVENSEELPAGPPPALKPAVPVEISAQSSPSGVYSGKRGFTEGMESDIPKPTFTILGADVIRVAAGPSLKFTVGIDEPEGREVFTVALNVQIHIDPAKRKYDPQTREKLFELFGDPSRWGATTKSMPWSQTFVLVPTFTGATTFDVPVLSNFDMELAATKYFYSLPDGEIPLTFHFSGSIYYRGEDGGIQIVQVPWSCSAAFRLPVERWKAMADHHYPNTAWIPMRRQTLDELLRFRKKEGLSTFDACVTRLLGVEDFHTVNPFAFRKGEDTEGDGSGLPDAGPKGPGESPSD